MNVSKHIFALGLVVALASPAMAAEDLVPPVADGPFSVTGSVDLTSEYFFRGLSQSNDSPAVQGGLNANYKINDMVAATVGLWSSSVASDTVANGSVELDWIAGLSGAVNDFSWNAGYTYFSYPGTSNPSSSEPDFYELSVGGAYNWGLFTTGVSYAYSPDFNLNSGTGKYINGKVTVPLKWVDLSGAVGKQFIEKNAVFGAKDYVDYKLAVGAKVYGLDLEAAFIDTNLNTRNTSQAADNQFVFTVTKNF